MRLLDILFLCLFAVSSTLAAAQEETSPTLGILHFESMSRIQIEVWIDGHRAGITPFTKKLAPGAHRLTASAEYVVPLMQTLTVEPGLEKAIVLPTDPLTTENYEKVSAWVAESIPHQPKNPHLLIISLYLTMQPGEAEQLLAMADKAVPKDGMVDLLRARVLVRAKKPQEALEAAERGLRTYKDLGFGWRMRAEAQRDLGSLDKALESANQAVALEPLCWRNQRTRARIHQEMGNARAQKADENRADELYNAMHRQMERLKTQ